MAWHCSEIILTLKTDMHCGAPVLGMVNRAFPYVPQHIPLYASVPAIVDALHLAPLRASYSSVEDVVFSCMCWSPLFVLDECAPRPRHLFPWKEEDLDVLEAQFMSSHMGVSLDYRKRTAEDGQLYEMESLLSCKRGTMQPTRLSGYLWLKEGQNDTLHLDPLRGVSRAEDSDFISWNNLLGKMILGGERTHNMGCLRPEVGMQPIRDNILWPELGKEQKKYITFDADSDFPRLHIPASLPCPMPLAKTSHGYGSPYIIMTGRKIIKSTGGYDMSRGVIARDMGWCSTQDSVVELSVPEDDNKAKGEARCARLIA